MHFEVILYPFLSAIKHERPNTCDCIASRIEFNVNQHDEFNNNRVRAN